MDIRKDFNETWLAEMPQNIGTFPLWDTIEYSIKDRIKHGSKVVELNNNLRKIDGEQVKYYWFEKNNEILLGAELLVKPQGLVVTALAKNPKHKGSPFASDLYEAILNDSTKAIKLFSDGDMSEEAFAVWKRLLGKGHKITIYDTTKPGQSMLTIETPEELEKYFKEDDLDYRNYRFVLSESGEMLAETRSFFNTRRMRELSGMPLE